MTVDQANKIDRVQTFRKVRKTDDITKENGCTQPPRFDQGRIYSLLQHTKNTRLGVLRDHVIGFEQRGQSLTEGYGQNFRFFVQVENPHVPIREHADAYAVH